MCICKGATDLQLLERDVQFHREAPAAERCR